MRRIRALSRRAGVLPDRLDDQTVERLVEEAERGIPAAKLRRRGPGEYVVSDEAGRPYHPDTLSDYRRSICAAAKVSSIRLYDARHTCGTLLHLQGQPVGVITLWLGYADPAFTLRTYVHPINDTLKGAAAALQRVVTPI